MPNNTTDVPVQSHGLGQVGDKDVKFAAFVIVGTLVVGAVLLGVAVLLHRLYRFVKLEKALRALKIPPARFQPEGAVNTVCTICIADFRPRARVAVLPTCGHVFHRHPGGGGGAEPTLPALSGSSAVKERLYRSLMVSRDKYEAAKLKKINQIKLTLPM